MTGHHLHTSRLNALRGNQERYDLIQKNIYKKEARTFLLFRLYTATGGRRGQVQLSSLLIFAFSCFVSIILASHCLCRCWQHSRLPATNPMHAWYPDRRVAPETRRSSHPSARRPWRRMVTGSRSSHLWTCSRRTRIRVLPPSPNPPPCFLLFFSLFSFLLPLFSLFFRLSLAPFTFPLTLSLSLSLFPSHSHSFLIPLLLSLTLSHALSLLIPLLSLSL